MYDLLTDDEKRAIELENTANGWGYSREDTLKYIEQHRTGDTKAKQAVRYRFEDVNYHSICRCLDKGDYAGAVAIVDKDWN